MKITLNEQDIFKLIKETVNKLLIEGINWGTNGNVANISINSKQDDKSNISGDMSVDTRVFGTKNNILHGDNSWKMNKSLETKYNEKDNTIKYYQSIIDYINNGRKGNYKDVLYTNGVPQKTLTDTSKWFINGVSDNKIKDAAIKAIARTKAEFNPISNTYNRVINSKNDNKVSRYITGIVPDTNVEYIALFSMKDFNFSDAIKHGYLRPNGNTDKLFGVTDNERPNGNIPVTYDNGIIPNIEQNFSLNNVKDGHFKQQYQYQGGKYNTSELDATDLQRELSKTKDYTSINQFIDKSIMYASYALKEENFYPDFIVAAPSSSKFNHYYCTNLSRKLGIEYIPDFFKRNAINVVFQEGDEEKMRQKGIPQVDIDDFKKRIKQIAFKEICYYVHKPITDFLVKYENIFSRLPIIKNSREKVDFDVVRKVILKYTTDLLINMVNDKEDYVAKYIIAKLGKQYRLQPSIEKTLKNKSSNTSDYNTKFMLEKFIEAMKINGLNREFINALNESYNLVIKHADILTNKGYRLRMDYQRAKITNFEKHLREYVHNLYIIADEHLTNGNLQKRYGNAKFLIFDEDINSGATLKLTIDALEDKLPSQNSNNIICLVNGYSASGF